MENSAQKVVLPLINIYPQSPRCSSRTQLSPAEVPMPWPAASTRPHPKPPPARPADHMRLV